MLAGTATLIFGILVRFNVALNSAGDPLTAVCRVDLTTEGLEPYHRLFLHLM